MRNDASYTAQYALLALVRAVFEVVVIVLALFSIFIIGHYLKPVVVDVDLAPAGIAQFGWPLPFSASYWEEMGMKSHNAQKFNVVAFAADFLVVYGAIRVGLFAILRVIRPIIPSIRRYDRHEH